MSQDFVFETADDGLLAPAVHTNFNLIDAQLAGELQKIPDQLAFKIGDVADLTSLKTYVLRYWETEFEQLRPKKSKHNQRVYSRRDVELVFLIKKLLYRDRYSIEGARTALRKYRKELKHVDAVAVAAEPEAVMELPVEAPEEFTAGAAGADVRRRLEEILNRIDRLKTIFS